MSKAADIQASLTDQLGDIVERINVFDTMPSTNSWLASQAPASRGQSHAVIALHQTAGRGRRGKVWQSPPESGLCLSVEYRFAEVPPQPAAMTLAVGVAVAQSLESIGLGDAMLKWPNDLVWQDRKLGGILVESSSPADGGFRVIVGIGINIQLPPEFLLDAANDSWARGAVDLAAAGIDTSVEQIACAIVPQVVHCLADYSAATLPTIIAEFNQRNWLHDRAAQRDDQLLRCVDIDEAGRLRAVDMQDGKQHVIDSGEVTPLKWMDAS